MNFQGSIVALVTPFDSRGRVDVKCLQELVRWHISEGTQGIVCSGTTGESTTLSESDRQKVLQGCLEAAEKRIPIIAGTGTCDTKQSVRLTQQAQRLGADGCLVITPYYNKPSQRGCILHFQEISRIGLPFIAYNNPGRTIVQLQPETIAAIGELPNAAGIKESTNDPLFLRKIRALTALPILAGEDALTHEMIKESAIGAISVVANIIPSAWKDMIRFSMSGEWTQAKKISDYYLPLCQALFLEANPQCVKYALSLMKKCSSRLRLPLIEPNETNQNEIKKAMSQFSTSAKSV